MSRRSNTTSMRSPKPRNRIVRAILSGIIAAGSGRHIRAHQKRSQARDDRDLDQRVRECGEW
ncbi:hypothetical protein [Polaromonas sp.]|uniref:hypothetical protein n=1 Tax=Polaromonas sp. TaxID=1869339 RepID=UPI00352A375E